MEKNAAKRLIYHQAFGEDSSPHLRMVPTDKFSIAHVGFDEVFR